MKTMNNKRQGNVEFLLYREPGEELYTAVCLTFNIIEQGADPMRLRESIEEAARNHLKTVVELGLDDGLLNRSAPKEYWDIANNVISEIQSKSESHQHGRREFITLPQRELCGV